MQIRHTDQEKSAWFESVFCVSEIPDRVDKSLDNFIFSGPFWEQFSSVNKSVRIMYESYPSHIIQPDL